MVALKVFPLSVGQWGREIRYNTTVTVGASGHEVRNANWQDALYSFNAKYMVKTRSDVSELEAFFHVNRGREGAFLVWDYLDYSASGTDIDIDNEADGVKTTFQLYKVYDDGLGTQTRRIINFPKSGTVFIAINAVTLDPSDYDVNYSTGVITFDTAPAAGATILAAFEFYVPCRFGADSFNAEAFNYWIDSGGNKQYRINLPDIPLMEVRV